METFSGENYGTPITLFLIDEELKLSGMNNILEKSLGVRCVKNRFVKSTFLSQMLDINTGTAQENIFSELLKK